MCPLVEIGLTDLPKTGRGGGDVPRLQQACTNREVLRLQIKKRNIEIVQRNLIYALFGVKAGIFEKSVFSILEK